MSFIAWLTLIGICVGGAMSPGPSLVVIIQNRIYRGLKGALAASWSHAAGIFLWALAASSILDTLFQRIPPVKSYLTLAGAAFLIYLAIKSLREQCHDLDYKNSKLPTPWLSGLSTSLLNPKIFIFFTALFSQFIPADPGVLTLLGMALVAGLVDGIWYSIASVLVGCTGLDKTLRRHGLLLNRLAAGVYLIAAAFSLSQIPNLMAS